MGWGGRESYKMKTYNFPLLSAGEMAISRSNVICLELVTNQMSAACCRHFIIQSQKTESRSKGIVAADK